MSIRRNPFAPLILICALCLPAVAQGYSYGVHRIVNRAATTHLPPSFQGFAQWVDDLEDLSTDPDERKCCVPGESIKHYIDIDDYPEFFSGTRPHAMGEGTRSDVYRSG